MDKNLLARTFQFAIFFVSLFGVTFTNYAWALGWEDQADRLQKVSSSLLDAHPVLTPSNEPSSRNIFRIEGKTILSVLPKMNSTVGSKKEQAPQPPVHTIPTVEALFQTSETDFGTFVTRGWVGYLPGAMSKFLGMDATCTQSIVGFAAGMHIGFIPEVQAQVSFGLQKNKAKVLGGITAKKSKDEFEVDTSINFASLIIIANDYPEFWGEIYAAERKVKSTLKIPSDGTKFNLNDQSQFSKNNPASQITVGYKIDETFSLAVSQINVPQRVSMPRILLSYQKSFE